MLCRKDDIFGRQIQENLRYDAEALKLKISF